MLISPILLYLKLYLESKSELSPFVEIRIRFARWRKLHHFQKNQYLFTCCLLLSNQQSCATWQFILEIVPIFSDPSARWRYLGSYQLIKLRDDIKLVGVKVGVNLESLLGNIIIYLETSILSWKYHFELGNLTMSLETPVRNKSFWDWKYDYLFGSKIVQFETLSCFQHDSLVSKFTLKFPSSKTCF